MITASHNFNTREARGMNSAKLHRDLGKLGRSRILKNESLEESEKRMSLMVNEIEKISASLDCPELTTSLLGDNHKLVAISEMNIMKELQLLENPSS
ncbi:hypothetical protein CARUB_v10011393mg [Capsella rubella]|uniref:Uncharacterized protein n=1 Tax=Capsella rubella TaxID=81985 RepID=R0IP87_9BRAS|nr:hypothetical protein CARUB_v10011393mg [Capsella rubella]